MLENSYRTCQLISRSSFSRRAIAVTLMLSWTIWIQRLFRQHCYQGPEGMYIKDLRILNRSLSSIVLVDNASYSFCFQIDNGIPIIPYYSGNTDYELCTLERYIQSLATVNDVREVNRDTFRLDRYISYNSPEHLV
jgi:CTD small phosphatase-like protein 2